MPASAAARRYRVCDRTAARAFTAYADEQLADLDEQQDPVPGQPGSMSSAAAPPPTAPTRRPAKSPGPAPEWLTHLVDLDAGGTLGLAEGRTAAAEEGLLAGHAARLRYLAMDLSATYRSGAPARGDPDRGRLSPGETRNRKIDEAFRRLSYRTEHAHAGTRPAPPAALHAPVQHREPGPRAPGHHHRRAGRRRRRPADRRRLDRQEHRRDLLALRATRTRVTPGVSVLNRGAVDPALAPGPS